MVMMDENPKRRYSWSEDIRNSLYDQGQLQTLSTEAVRTFAWDKLEITEEAEVASPADVPKQDEFRRLLQAFIEGIEQSTLLEVHSLDGLVHIIKNHPQENFDTDDLIKILSLLGGRLNTHQQFMQYTLRLATAVSRALDSMVDSQVEGIDFPRLHEPLSDYLKRLQQSSNPCLVFQAAYAYQALQYIPDDKSILKSMMRCTGRVTQGISGATTAAKSLELKQFIEGLQDTQDGLEREVKPIAIIGKSYQNSEKLAGSGHRFLECLREGFSFSRKSAWYPALRGLDTLLQEDRVVAFEELIREAPCRHNPAFQWGVCQRLGEMAANPVWDTVTRKGAVSLLGELYTDDSRWGKQIDVKQWILHILVELTKFAEGAVGDKAQMLLNGWEVDGDHETRLLYQVHMKEGQISRSLTFSLPPPCGFWFIDCAQEITESDVESRVCQLKRKRLGEIGGDVYIPLKVELSSAIGDFDLMSKVQEFLKSNDKVFLLLGDSGAGKSTFSRALEIGLWREYREATGRIPLFIHLSTIEKPGQNLIAERLRNANFTESQILELKENREFILICDGYDESQQTQNLYTSNQLNQPGEWRAQMVISCRTEYNGVDYKNRFQPVDRNNGGKMGLFQEAVIAPFNKNQIEDYISQFVSWNKPFWKTEDYLQALKSISGLRNLDYFGSVTETFGDENQFKYSYYPRRAV
ncbi:hypothetical protein BGX21_005367 [Mortierella sp. AD011]|nr:hypothetical protein BGX20_009280 [Mortierella sp. AD010]KAF9399920.1 hypothetical protein BGX21_005367 [Mortierella sp. AD011]